jgi:zinc finger SWIM domain-containing protein 3
MPSLMVTYSSTTLKVFVEQFKNALRNKVEKEIKSDFDCFKGKLECSSSSPMEKQFQEAYTHEVFKWVRIEFSRRQDCIVKKIVRGGEEVKYKIQDEAAIMRVFEVRFSSSECLVGCVCRMFEFRGIFCRHVLFVLSQESVTVLPRGIY